MKNKLLFAHKHRTWASLLFVSSFVLLVTSMLLEWTPDLLDVSVFSITGTDAFVNEEPKRFIITNNILDELLSIIAIIFGIVWAFSKEVIEDELIASIRKEALMISVYINYGVYILATLFVFGFAFLNVLMLNVFTILIIFIAIFNYKKYQLKTASDEE